MIYLIYTLFSKVVMFDPTVNLGKYAKGGFHPKTEFVKGDKRITGKNHYLWVNGNYKKQNRRADPAYFEWRR